MGDNTRPVPTATWGEINLLDRVRFHCRDDKPPCAASRGYVGHSDTADRIRFTGVADGGRVFSRHDESDIAVDNRRISAICMYVRDKLRVCHRGIWIDDNLDMALAHVVVWHKPG